MEKLVFTLNNLSKDKINYCNLIENKEYSISKSIIEELSINKKLIKKFIIFLYNEDIKEITIYNFFTQIVSINKLDLLKILLSYVEQKDIVDFEIYQVLKELKEEFDYNNINKHCYNRVEIDDRLYFIPLITCISFLELNELEFKNIVLNEKRYNNIRLEALIYSIIDYFSLNNLFSKYMFPDKIVKRYLDLKNNKYIDIEGLNKCLETKDKLLNQVKLNEELLEVINKKYDFSTLNNIIRVYIKLCKLLTYDEKYYFDEIGNLDLYIKHMDLSNLTKINEENNKIVCFEFTEIFGYFLNSIGINYEVIGNQDHYGFAHSYIIFRYDKYLIKVEPVNKLFNNDLANAKVNQALIGITCINQNTKTRREFKKILDYCYNIKEIEFNEYLPYNKIENSVELDDIKRSIVNKIDLIFEKLDNAKLGIMDKCAYLKILIDKIFTTKELENNLSYCVVTNYSDLVYVFTINSKNYNNGDNLYLIYKDNKLSFISKETLIYMFEHQLLVYLTNKEIPGLKDKDKVNKKGIRK